MIREATAADLPRLMEIGRAFHAAAGLGRLAPLDETSLTNTLTFLINSPDGVVLVSDTGAAGALLHPAWFNGSHRTGQEMFWWGDAALFAALEEWARANGAHSFTMVALEALRPEAVGAVYRRRGYLLSEHSYTKRF